MRVMEVSDGKGRGQGRPRQEGQAQEGQQAGLDLIFQELAFGREHLLMSDTMCTICHQPEAAHVEGRVRHTFTPAGTPVDTSQFAPKRSVGAPGGDDTSRRIPSSYGVSQTPFDPVLRQALIDKGILSVQDLQDAEQKVHFLTGQVVRGGTRG